MPRDDRRHPSVAGRLKDISPRLYRIVGPFARGLRRALNLTIGRVEAAVYLRALKRHFGSRQLALMCKLLRRQIVSADA